MQSTKRTSDVLYGMILIVISAACYGAMPIFASIAYADGLNTISLLFIRFTIAASIMFLVMLLRRIAMPKGRTLIILILMGLVGYAGQSFTYFFALNYAPAGMVAILLYLFPGIVMAISAILFKEVLTRQKLLLLGVAMVGTLLVIDWEVGGQSLGIMLGVASAFLYATYILVGSRFARGVDVVATGAIIMGSTAVTYGMVVLVQGIAWPGGIPGWSATLALSLISTVGATLTFFAGLRRVGAVNASMLSTFEPVVTVALAFVFLDESLTPINLLGGVLVLGAALYLTQRA